MQEYREHNGNEFDHSGGDWKLFVIPGEIACPQRWKNTTATVSTIQ